MKLRAISALAVLTACNASTPPAATAEPATASLGEEPQIAAAPVEVAPPPEPEPATAPTLRARPCANLVACLETCEACDDVHRAQAKQVTTNCARKCPAIQAKKRAAQVAKEFWGFSLGSSLADAGRRCSEIRGVWSEVQDNTYAAKCQAAIGPWGVPVDVLLSSYEDQLSRVELVYAYGEGETATQLLPLFGHLLQQTLGPPTYSDTGKRSQFSWMSGTGGTPYCSLLLDDEERTASIWIQPEK